MDQALPSQSPLAQRPHWDHFHKLSCAIVDLNRRGVDGATVDPPWIRVFWLIGIELPPPVFMSCRAAMVLFGSVTAVVMFVFTAHLAVFFDISHYALSVARFDPAGGIVWYIANVNLWAWPILYATGLSAAIGLIAGCQFAASCAQEARMHLLPSWDEYDPCIY